MIKKWKAEDHIKELKDDLYARCHFCRDLYKDVCPDIKCRDHDFGNAEKAAIHALEKQVPMAPDGNKCPRCGAENFDLDGCGYAYCPECGQALDWSDDDGL